MLPRIKGPFTIPLQNRGIDIWKEGCDVGKKKMSIFLLLLLLLCFIDKKIYGRSVPVLSNLINI